MPIIKPSLPIKALHMCTLRSLVFSANQTGLQSAWTQISENVYGVFPEKLN